MQPKGSKPHTTTYNAYSQSWVFEADTATTSNNTSSPYLKILENGTTQNGIGSPKQQHILENGLPSDTTHLIDNPVVHIEEASDDSTSNSDRKLCHMRSFSRSASPIILSASSSQNNLHQSTTAGIPPIYDCLESIYRTRLTSGEGAMREESHYQAPQAMVMRRIESVSPHAEKVQYASLMKELQRAIVSKKETNSVTSPLSTSDSATTSEKTQTDSKSSSRQDSSCKSSDAEFSKELEAALQLIQDLESPNTIETPSEPKSDKDIRPLTVWRNSDASESEKTLSAVGSLAEIASPECHHHHQEMYTFKPQNGKDAKVVIHHYPDSQSTSGYSSPTHPSWSTTSSLNGSNNDMAYSIHNADTTTVISLYSQVNPPQSKGNKSITLVNITNPTTTLPFPIAQQQQQQQAAKQNVWIKSLLRKKKQALPPKLCPELEAAIIKSESLAYLSELELLARHERNKEIQRVRIIIMVGAGHTHHLGLTNKLVEALLLTIFICFFQRLILFLIV